MNETWGSLTSTYVYLYTQHTWTYIHTGMDHMPEHHHSCCLDMSHRPAQVCSRRERWTGMKTNSSKSEETFVARKASTSKSEIKLKSTFQSGDAAVILQTGMNANWPQNKEAFFQMLLLSFSLFVFKILSWKQLRSSCCISLYSYPQLAQALVISSKLKLSANLGLVLPLLLTTVWIWADWLLKCRFHTLVSSVMLE